MKVTISAKQSTVKIENKSIELHSVPPINFINQLEREVIANPKQAKKLKRLLITTSTMCLSMLLLTQPTMASAIIPAPTHHPNIDPDIVQTLIILMLTCAGLGVLASVVGLMAAGVWKMFFGGSQADQWRQNIYRGLAQVLLAPVSVALIVGMAMLLFSNLPAFKPLVKPITAWFMLG